MSVLFNRRPKSVTVGSSFVRRGSFSTWRTPLLVGMYGNHLFGGPSPRIALRVICCRCEFVVDQVKDNKPEVQCIGNDQRQDLVSITKLELQVGRCPASWVGPVLEGHAGDLDQPKGTPPFREVPKDTSKGDKGRWPLLQDVVFYYPARPEVKILNGLSMSITRGQKVAVVGESGSGKSTVMALLERFYDPNTGTVLVNGQDG